MKSSCNNWSDAGITKDDEEDMFTDSSDEGMRERRNVGVGVVSC